MAKVGAYVLMDMWPPADGSAQGDSLPLDSDRNNHPTGKSAMGVQRLYSFLTRDDRRPQLSEAVALPGDEGSRRLSNA